MHGLTNYLPTAYRERLIVLALAIASIVCLSALTPPAAHASGCTDSWTNTAGGSWFTPGNWSTGKVPTSTDEVCITESGTYTVEMTQESGTVSVKSLTIGGTSGTQTLVVGSSCSVNAILNTTSGLSTGTQGAITLTNGDGCGDSVTLAGPITNAGTLTTEVSHGGSRSLEGAITNTGTLAINANTAYNGTSAVLTNKGALNLAEGIQLTVSSGDSVTNGSGGKIAATGTADVFMNSGSTFTEGAGTTSGTKPVIVDDGALAYIGGGKSQIAARGSSTLSGNLASGQALSVDSTCSENTTVTAAASFTNGGVITLTNGDGCGDSAALVVSTGTLTNSGTLTSEPAHGGSRTIQGNLKNTGTLAINVSTAYNGKGAALTNEGALDLAESTQLAVSNEGSVTNGAGGKIVATGSGAVAMGSATSFTEGAGTTSGTKPVIVDDAKLSYTGVGASTIALRGNSTLTGNLSTGQSLSIESTCSENATTTAATSFTNGGVITLTNGDGCGNNAALIVSAGTLTNSGKIATEPAIGGSRTIQGSVTNTGTLAVKATVLYNSASATFTNEGTVNIAEGTQVSVSGGSSFTNGIGGALVASGSGVLSEVGGTFTEGAGTTSGTKPVIVDDAKLSYTGVGASTIALRGNSTLTGNLSTGQSLSIESTCSENATTTAATSFTNGGVITLTNGDGCGNNAALIVSAGVLTNAGRLVTEPAIGGSRTIQGNVTNQLGGTIGIKTNTQYNTDSNLINEGTINLAEGAVWSLSGGGNVYNYAGGDIVSAGSGALSQTGGTFNELDGKTSGTEPVILDDAALNYGNGTATEHGTGRIALRGASTLSGNIRQGEALVIESTCGENAVVTAANSFFNAGKLELTNGDGCGNSATLDILRGGTLENTGTLNVLNPHGGGRTIEGNVKNAATISLAAGETLHVTGYYKEESSGVKLKISIASESSYGALSIGGEAKLHGTPELIQVAPFKASLGQTYTIVTFASTSTTQFSGLTEDQINATGLYYQPTYSTTAVKLVVTQATLATSVSEGLPGMTVTVSGSGYLPGDTITPTFTDHKGVVTTFPTVTTNGSGEYSTEITIPLSAATGVGKIKAVSSLTGVHINQLFHVT